MAKDISDHSVNKAAAVSAGKGTPQYATPESGFAEDPKASCLAWSLV